MSAIRKLSRCAILDDITGFSYSGPVWLPRPQPSCSSGWWTPAVNGRRLRRLCALVDPKLGDLICDPACGTGGFLLGAYQHILTAHTSPALRHVDENGMERGLVSG